MRRRAASPAPSEGEVDILGEIYQDDSDKNPKPAKRKRKDAFDLDMDDVLDGAPGSDQDDDEAFIALQQAASFRKASNLKGKSVKKGGGFQAMGTLPRRLPIWLRTRNFADTKDPGINANLLRAIARKGFTAPTPIQRKTIPLILSRKDVVGMARTGSGKTAAFVIPMIERLKAHSVQVGARALVLSPSRELAIQTLKVVKEMGRGTDLKAVLLVGGDSMDEQFGKMASNPDVVIATPGRFLHLKVEMGLDLSSVRYVVFDEADRLFEMGFKEQLTEILHSLPAGRQTLLFSATLPASLVEFANAGLQDPSLVRLDAETKISPDLKSAFFSVKGSDKEGALLHILHDVVKMPLGAPAGSAAERAPPSNKRKRGTAVEGGGKGKPTEHSTILFAATKHRVEYLAALLRQAGFAVSYVYGSLDQEARRIQVEDFRRGKSNILVVTDVAARGIDIPILQNVINYDFPPQPKVFVHRVGRTARAGQQGWSYSLVRDLDAPYLLDLQLFLGRKLVIGQEGSTSTSFTEDVVVGAMPRGELETHVEWLNKTLDENIDLSSIRAVAEKAEKQYMKTRNAAAAESAKRAREIVSSEPWSHLNKVYGNQPDNAAAAKMLATIGSFKPAETIFEIGRGAKTSNTEAAEVMKQFRKRVGPRREKKKFKPDRDLDIDSDMEMDGNVPLTALNQDIELGEDGDIGEAITQEYHSDVDSDSDFEVTVTNPDKTSSFQDPDVFMSYTPRESRAEEERGYGVHSGTQATSFVLAARDAAMDLTNDETAKSFGVASRPSAMRWDKRSKKYVQRQNDADGSRGTPKMIMGESGVRIAASYQSGRFERWKKANRVSDMPRVGEMEKGGNRFRNLGGDKDGASSYRHKQQKAPKEADKYRDDFRVRKKRVEEAREKRVGRFKDGQGSKKEIKGAEVIRKGRKELQKKREKNARPSRR